MTSFIRKPTLNSLRSGKSDPILVPPTLIIPIYGRSAEYNDVVVTGKKNNIFDWNRLISVFDHYMFDRNTANPKFNFIIVIRQQDISDVDLPFPSNLMLDLKF